MSHNKKGEFGQEHEEAERRKDALVFASAMAGAETSDRSVSSPNQSMREDTLYFDGEGQTHSILHTEDRPRHGSPLVTPPARVYKPSILKEKERVGSTGVPHVYHDFSQVPDVLDYTRKKTGGVTQPFPEKLHEMLNDVEGSIDCDIVSWLSHGRAFIVHKPREFTEKIMPRHFKQTKLTSFQRQLNLYGFRRLTQGPDAGAYYHERFLRARPALCQQMARQKVKGTGHKQPADAKTEPNFYSMRPIEPVPPAVHKFAENEQQDETQGTDYAIGPFEGMADYSYPHYEADRAYSEVSSAAVGSMPSTFTSYSRLPPVSFDSLSPASPGMTGAAHLLTGISQGYMGNLSIPLDTQMNEKGGSADYDEDGKDGHQFLQPRLAPSSMRRDTESPPRKEPV